MAELTAEQKQVIEDYLSKEVALTQAQKKAVEDYLSNRADLSRAEKTRINSYLIKVILSILAVLGVTTLVAVPPLWNKMIESIKMDAVKEVKDEVNQDLKDNDITRENLAVKAADLNGQFNLLLANITDIQDNVFTLQTSELNQLGQSVTKFTETLGEQTPEGKSALEVLTEHGKRITDLASQIKALETNLKGVSIKIITNVQTDEGGRFTELHGLESSNSILWASFAMKSGTDSNWYTMTPDNDNPRSSENWLYWDDTRIRGEINMGVFAKQPVNLILFLKK